MKDLPVMEAFHATLTCDFKIHMNYIIEGKGALINETGEEKPLKAGDFALVLPDKNTSIVTRVISLLK